MAGPRRLRPPERFDLAGTLRALGLVPRDPTVVPDPADAWWATLTPDGAGSLRLLREGDTLAATAYG
ncbi:MAG: DNA-3-methyladenine glycosylase 2 family protein, partial [Dactylosporangium sp.]|nr:DNA-3-methyladenine glycosylase 2 family protein [Dactylosporangium sp.]